jgi:hypothetical protein
MGYGFSIRQKRQKRGILCRLRQYGGKSGGVRWSAAVVGLKNRSPQRPRCGTMLTAAYRECHTCLRRFAWVGMPSAKRWSASAGIRGRFAPEWVDGMRCNRWTAPAGISGRHAPESVDGLRRIMNFWNPKHVGHALPKACVTSFDMNKLIKI